MKHVRAICDGTADVHLSEYHSLIDLDIRPCSLPDDIPKTDMPRLRAVSKVLKRISIDLIQIVRLHSLIYRFFPQRITNERIQGTINTG